MDHGLERLSREVHKIVGTKVPDEQLKDLLGLKPLSPQSVNRFFQAQKRIQLKKGQSALIVQALENVRGTPAATLPSRPSAPHSDDPDLAPLATEEGRELAKV